MDLSGQTFTLEGVAASLLLLLAVYTIFQSTVVVAPMWSEYTNVQLRQLAYDILRVLDTAGGNASLRGLIENGTCSATGFSPPPEFAANFSFILDKISANARLELVYVNETTKEIQTRVVDGFNKTPTPNAVRATRFVVVPDLENTCFVPAKQPKVVEVRLTLWRT